MPRSRFDIASSALVAIGANAINSFDDGTDEALAVAQFWDGTVENWLSLYPWRFATHTAQLSRISEAPTSGWDAAYREPTDMLALHHVEINDEPIPYSRYRREIHCDASETDAVYAEYVYSADESIWPPYFATLIEHALQNRLAFALAGKLDLKADNKADMMEQFSLAKNADARQQTTRRLNMRGRGSLLAARRA